MSDNRNTVIVALILVILGFMFLVGQFLGGLFWHYAWPFFVIIPGLLFFAGMVVAGKNGGGLAIPGSIVTTVGLILFYQNITGHFESWAYIWTLIFPLSVGVGLMIQGLWSGQPAVLEHGKRMALAGIVIFLIAAAFFEGIIGIGGHGLGRYGWPLLLIAAGILLLLRRGLMSGRKSGGAAGNNEPFDPSRKNE